MHIIHGTWIPRESDDFVQDGDFCLWVETDAPVRHASVKGDRQVHPRHLSHQALAAFLDETLGIRTVYGGDVGTLLTPLVFQLPSAAGAPLPSPELVPYIEHVDEEIPTEWELRPWQIWCLPLRHWPVIGTLRDIHFAALNDADDFQMGADLLFWYQYTQVLKGIMLGDNYIPALTYRALPTGDGGPGFELHGGWELISQKYDTAIERYAACMPPVCLAGSDGPDCDGLYAAETLLRHCSEHLLDAVLLGAPVPVALERRIDGSLLQLCWHHLTPIAGSAEALTLYRQWADWRARLTASQASAGFTLCFRLEEARAEEVDAWHISLLVASRHDPSLKIPLAEYWSLGADERVRLAAHLGQDFEKHLLLALGHAARIYPKVWDGMETDRPAGFELTLQEAFAFLREHAWVLEDAGYTVIVPAWATPQGRRRAKVRMKTAAKPSGGSGNSKSYFSFDTLISYQYELSIGGNTVSKAEWQQLIEAKTPLVQFRGQWMELDRDGMQQMLSLWEQRQQTQPEIGLLDLMKLAAEEDGAVEWDHDQALHEVLAGLQDKSVLQQLEDPPNFQGELREYQKQGVAWLRYLERLGLNPCLADDMGLGKTVQVIAQLVAERNDAAEAPPTLLIAPTSVLGNWRKEIERFAPQLRTLVHQGAGRSKEAAGFTAACDQVDVVITSFALARLDAKLLHGREWRRMVVDEAQNIKNPQSAQSRAIAKVSARHRLALTGTPVENRLRDLWSIFNFLNPGYLGKEPQFRKAFEIPIQRDHDESRAAALRKLVEPFILRRLKTDRRIIDDLPDKIEQKVYCNLTPEQASLYEAVVKDVEAQLEEADGMQRRGLILATLTKLKQVCNHPAQFLQDGSEFSAERSHKLQRLTEMVEEAIENGESLLIFTQYTEIGAALQRFLSRTLHCNTYYLHGGTPAARRESMVAEFQNPATAPAVFVLSVRAGGTGLTLTKANHVFHFDRWWNPAVEDQATDRAFRIGQSKNVFAHKFVALGTVEERIDQMIEDKKRLAQSITGTDEAWLTELDNDTFRDLIALRRSAIMEAA